MRAVGATLSAAALLLLALATGAQATTLEEAMAAALANAPEMALAEAGEDAAKGRLLSARAGQWPSVSLSGSIGRGRLDPQGFFGLPRADVTPRALQGTIEQPLFSGGRAMAMVGAAKAGVVAAEAGGAATASGLLLAVVEAYGGVLAAAESVRHYSRLAEQMAEAQRQARERYDAGEAPSTDVAQAAARLAEARAALAAALGEAASVRARYRHLVGEEPADLAPLPGNPPLPATLDEAQALARQRSPALRQAEAGLRGAQAAARAAKAGWLPEVSAFAEGALVRDQFFPDYRSNGATVGVRGRWTLFSARTMGETQEKSAEARAAEARLRAARLEVEEAVLAAYRHVETARLVEEASISQAAAAQQALDAVREEVSVGMKPPLALLDAAREAAAAGAAAARASTARLVAAFQLKALTGG